VSYLAFGLNRRRKTAELRRKALSGLVSPALEHPELGVGGRSIELSLSLGKPASADAIVLATESLDDFVAGLGGTATDRDLAAGRSAVSLLKRAAAGVRLPRSTRDLLRRVERNLSALP